MHLKFANYGRTASQNHDADVRGRSSAIREYLGQHEPHSIMSAFVYKNIQNTRPATGFQSIFLSNHHSEQANITQTSNLKQRLWPQQEARARSGNTSGAGRAQ
jgi:hypothetical protein